jgi:copper oxidase (laccase) domain-containing protein
MEWREREGLRWLAWEGAGVAAAFPTRQGGVSPAPYEGLNLGLSVADAPMNVVENRRRWVAAIGLSLDRLVVPGQVHGAAVTEVGEAQAGRGAWTPATSSRTRMRCSRPSRVSASP